MISNLQDLFYNISNNYKIYHTLEKSLHIIDKYNGTDWLSYIVNAENTYYKNLVFRTELMEMYIITWPLNISSCIHDHPRYGCILRVMKGKLEETTYDKLDDSHAKIKETIILNENSVGFRISDTILHKIKNINDDISVSIHIYAAPNYICNKYTVNT